MPLPATVLTTPWMQLATLGPGRCRKIAAIANPWDRDVTLNLALGLPEKVLTRAEDILRLNHNQGA